MVVNMANAVKHGKGSKVFIGAYDFTGQGRSIDLTVFEADMADATVFTSAARVKSPGSYRARVDHKGIYTNVVSGWDNWLVSKLGSMSGQPLSVLLGQPSEGDIAYHGEILTSNVKVPVKVDDVIATEATYEIHKALARGTILANRTSNIAGAITNWSAVGYQLGPIAAGEVLQVTIHAYSKSNSGTYTVRVEQSSGDSVYSAITGGSVVVATESGEVGSAVLRVAGPIDDYIRAGGVAENLHASRCDCIVVASKIHGSE